jgi:hypothetical protein
MGAMRKIWVTSLLAAAVAATGLAGCTIFGVKDHPTVQSTTSAEQYERLFWSAVKAKSWPQVPGFLGANVVYTAGGKALSKDQVVPYLQGANIADFTLSGIVIKPNGPDMTLTYTLQLSAAGGPVQNFNVVSVWQQVGQNLILIVHTEQPSN